MPEIFLEVVIHTPDFFFHALLESVPYIDYFAQMLADARAFK